MLRDATYLAAKAGPTGSFDISSDGVVTVHRPLDAELPAPARALLGDRITVTERQAWAGVTDDGSHQAELTVEIPGAPATITGRMVLSTAGPTCQLDITADIEVRVPVFGSMAESLIRDQLAAAVNHEESVAAGWLAAR